MASVNESETDQASSEDESESKMESDRISIEHLNEDNYYTFAYKMEAFLTIKGLWSYVTTASVPEAVLPKDKKCLAYIRIYAELYQSELTECTTAKKAWDKLAEINKSKSKARELYLQQQLVQLRRKSGESLPKYIARSLEVRDQLKGVGATVSESEMVMRVLAGLPSDFDTIVAIIGLVSPVLVWVIPNKKLA